MNSDIGSILEIFTAYMKSMLRLLITAIAHVFLFLGIYMLSSSIAPYYGSLSDISIQNILLDSMKQFGALGQLLDFGLSLIGMASLSAQLDSAQSLLISDISYGLLTIFTFWLGSIILKFIKKIFGDPARLTFMDCVCYLIIAPAAVINARLLNTIADRVYNSIGYTASVIVIIAGVIAIYGVYALIGKARGRSINFIDTLMKVMLSILLLTCIYLMTMCAVSMSSLPYMNIGEILVWIVLVFVSVCGVAVSGTSLIVGVDSFI